jgi:hypothetical protein
MTTTMSRVLRSEDSVFDRIHSVPTTIISRRTLQYALGVLWLLDGCLQLQPFMFTRGFARQVIAPAAAGQPFFVAGPVHWNAHLIALHPALFNVFFAGAQLALGVGFLIPRFCRWAIVGSVAWAAGVWYLGEGLGGVAGGHMTALLGAPGAALLYLVLALASWPSAPRSEDRLAAVSKVRPPGWVGPAWAILWIGFAVLDLLPGNATSSALAVDLTTEATGVPSWLSGFDRWLAGGVHNLGPGIALLLVGTELAIGLLSLGRGPIRSLAIWSGITLAALYWAAGQSFGQLFDGQATDPSTGPLLMLFGLAALSAAPRRCPEVPPTPPQSTRRERDASTPGSDLVRSGPPDGG